MNLALYTTLTDLSKKLKTPYATLWNRVRNRKARTKKLGPTLLVHKDDVCKIRRGR